MKSIYINYRSILSFKKRIMILIGGRGVGKTYGAKDFILSKCLNSSKKFVWLRATKTMCDTLKGDKGQALFKDVLIKEEKYNGFSYVINGDGTIEFSKGEDKKVVGYLMSLTEYYKYKGNDFSDVEYIVFDEFMSENGEVVRGNRVIQFLNTLETVCRNRENIKIFLLSNATNLGDDILELFFTGVKSGAYGFYTNNEKDAVLWYMKSSDAYLETKRNSPVGKIIKGTPYEETIIDNKFRTYDSDYFDNMAPNSNIVFTIKIEDNIIGFYRTSDLPYYFAKIVYSSIEPCFVLKMEDKTDGTVVANNIFKNNLKELAYNNMIKYANESVRLKVVSFLN